MDVKLKCPHCDKCFNVEVLAIGGGGPGDKHDENSGTGETPPKRKWVDRDSYYIQAEG